jgi:hypothetical protein
MSTTLFSTATEYTANQITLTRGTESQIVSVGVAMVSNPNTVPAVSDFTTVLLVGPVTTPTSPLLDGTKIDVVAKIGPGGGGVTAGHFPTLTPNDYQRWVLVTTADEHVIRRPDVVTIT